MTEPMTGFMFFTYIILTAITALLYQLGGRDDTVWYQHKWIRRFLAPIVFTSGLVFFLIQRSYTITNLIIVAATFLTCMILSYVQGYGGDTLGVKIVRRSKAYIFLVPAVVLLGFITKSWLLMSLQIGFGYTSTIILGCFNPMDAAEEEFAICFISLFFIGAML